MSAARLPIALFHEPAPHVAPSSIPPEELETYTGWFRTNAGARIVIMRDGSRQRLGYIEDVQGAITKSVDLQLEGVRRIYRGGATLEEKEVNRNIQAMAKATPGDFEVFFGVKHCKIIHVEIGRDQYERTEKGVCLITTLPPEVRERIWRQVLRDAFPQDKDRIVLTAQYGPLAIVGPDLKEFRNDAKLLEFDFQPILVSNSLAVTKLLRPRNPEVARYLRQVDLHFHFGPGSNPPQSFLFNLLDFGLATPTCNVNLFMFLWKIKSKKAKDVYNFMQYGFNANYCDQAERSFVPAEVE
ncbi:hypothetical protein EK21DRAFT_53296 [Setomelanomma holmii]|uniref:Uncharacterized protein n=1 Tax=Setomelanomma holmii TaxID=210430 RepID=A0A9P4LTP4_9PLEO|nr:hypothetical protein EK21DRAFT_53296 [Setomelanomma holmii]